MAHDNRLVHRAQAVAEDVVPHGEWQWAEEGEPATEAQQPDDLVEGVGLKAETDLVTTHLGTLYKLRTYLRSPSLLSRLPSPRTTAAKGAISVWNAVVFE